MRLYRAPLTAWYRLIDPHEEHADEAACYRAALERGAPEAETLLELGSGAGNNAWFLKQRFRCTLSDLSEDMLALSRTLNPDCEHLVGDMRTLRLGRTFDTVLVHDAVMYMTSEQDLRAVMRTAFEHTRPGGACVFAPDCTTETFRDQTNLITGDDGQRSLRGMEWSWDPDPGDETSAVEYVFALRENGEVSTFHDHHVEGLFPRSSWRSWLESAGYVVEGMPRPLDDGGFDEIFSCVRRFR